MEEVSVFSVENGREFRLGVKDQPRRDSDAWKTCNCSNVRAVTICIGLVFLVMYIVVLAVSVNLLIQEPSQDYTSIKPHLKIIIFASINILLLLLMFLGIWRVKPLCIWPFLLYRILECCLFSLTLLFYYLLYVIKGVWNLEYTLNIDICIHDEFLPSHPVLVSYIICLLIALRIYIIWVICKCHKYLKTRRNA
ncbi:unnamed protein product [Orchesella dallaii]|uniref:Uncharacterized protein n=1 Tax=Orchesella dallaii TaxID=48710 RepID=A0ABP1RQB7_9HEXA